MINVSQDQHRWISASDAAARLGIKPASLYAYVSRGLVARHLADDGRSSRFDEADIEQLARKGRPRRSSRDPMVEVVVQSALTSVPTGPSQRGGHRYRGQCAIELADGHRFESVVGLLLDGDLEPLELEADATRRPPRRRDHADVMFSLRSCVERAALDDPLRHDLSPASLRAATARTLAAMVGSFENRHDPGASRRTSPRLTLPNGSTHSDTVAARLAMSLSSRRPASWVVEGVNATLVLLADHELATSTLAARVAASTRADPYACVVAALATLSGPLHGTASAVVRAALESERPAEQLARSAGTTRLPGFGHPLYEGIDPRAEALLARVRAAAPGHPALLAARRLTATVRRRSGVPPNVDLGLAVFAAAAELHPDAGAVMFAVARTAGWMAHIAEEYTAPPLRYRARAVHVG